MMKGICSQASLRKDMLNQVKQVSFLQCFHTAFSMLIPPLNSWKGNGVKNSTFSNFHSPTFPPYPFSLPRPLSTSFPVKAYQNAACLLLRMYVSGKAIHFHLALLILDPPKPFHLDKARYENLRLKSKGTHFLVRTVVSLWRNSAEKFYEASLQEVAWWQPCWVILSHTVTTTVWRPEIIHTWKFGSLL